MSIKEKITNGVTLLAEAFGRKATKATFAAYEHGLGGLDLPAIDRAVKTALRTCKFMPSPAELRELAGEIRIEDRAIHAWMAFEKAVCTIGHVRGVDFDDAVINATVRSLGGWDRCCQLEGNEFDVFLRKRFIDAYVALTRSGVGDEQGAALEGAFDRENRRLGYAAQEPVMISTGVTGLNITHNP